MLVVISLIALHAQLKKSRIESEKRNKTEAVLEQTTNRENQNREASIQEIKKSLEPTPLPEDPLKQEPRLSEVSGN